MGTRWLLALLLGPMFLACTPRDDGFILLRRREVRLDNERTQLAYAQPDDPTGAHVRALLADGFGAELLRTQAMARRLGGQATGPAIVAMGSEDTYQGQPYRERQFDAGWFKEELPARTPIAWIDERDPTPITAQLVTGLANAILDSAIGNGAVSAPVLREGYATFLAVVAGEWNPANDVSARDQAGLRALPAFATVRANAAVPARDCFGDPLPYVRNARALVGDPMVVATILYRMAASELGRRMAPAAVYEPLLDSPPPHGIHPALLLGAFRNFQAKLLISWRNAVTAGRPPHDITELLEAYMETFPVERPVATRILLVTTEGETVLPVSEQHDRHVGIEQLTAEVLFGSRSLRDALRPFPHD